MDPVRRRDPDEPSALPSWLNQNVDFFVGEVDMSGTDRSNLGGIQDQHDCDGVALLDIQLREEAIDVRVTADGAPEQPKTQAAAG